MLRSRNILVQRAMDAHKASRDELRKSGKKTSVSSGISATDIDHWFRNSQQAIRDRQRLSDDEFQEFLRKKMQQVKKEREVAEREKKKKEREAEKQQKKEQEAEKRLQQEREAEKQLQKEQEAAKKAKYKSNGCDGDESLMMPPISPIRKKRKANPPKRYQQQTNSVTLGEDPELDQLIEGIVREFTDDVTKKGGVEFDGSAVSALREAANETLTVSLTRGGQELAAASDHTRESTTDATTDRHTFGRKSKKPTHNKKVDEDAADERITNMIEQLIGEVGCQFDGDALDALKEAAKDIAKP